MRYSSLPRGARRIALAIILVLPWPAQAASRFFEFLYINASEGSASGGHAAIKFDTQVFHFQHVEPGLLRAYRDDFPTFRFTYGYQENRTIQGHRIEVTEDVFQTLRDAFNRRLLIQNRQFALLNGLNDDRHLLADLKQPSTDKPAPARVELKALGYFVSDYRFGEGIVTPKHAASNASSQLAELKRVVVAEYGDAWLRQKRQLAWERLQALRPSLSDTAFAITDDRFEAGGYSFARRYRDQLLNLAALDVLESGMAPRPETLLTADLPAFRLGAAAIAKLADFRQTLFTDLIKLMDSERGDWGYPLLVGMARLQALDQSIHSGQLVVLDRFQPVDGYGYRKTFGVDADNLPALLKYAENIMGRATSRLIRSDGLDERGYGEIEVSAGTLLHTQAAVQSKQAAALPAVSSTPSLIASAELVPLPLTSSELESHERLLAAWLDAYDDKLQSLYRYQLLNRNCVTEIFRIINASLGQQFASRTDAGEVLPDAIRQTSERLLGGYIDDQAMNIIPFAAFDQVGSRYRLHSSYRLPPYREQQIERHYQSSTHILVDLTESNILTSSIYRWHGEDAAFMFFTQDAVWPRPLLGGANLAVALGQTIYGLVALPWDAGQNLQKSLKGIGVSLPELFFFNIRKGSFPRSIPDVSAINDAD